MAETGHDERRKHKRISFIKEVVVDEIGLLRCSDLSAGGIYLETIQPYQVGTILNLQFKLYDTDDCPIKIQAQVVYKHQGMGVGLCFLDLKFEDRIKIEKFIDDR